MLSTVIGEVDGFEVIGTVGLILKVYRPWP